MSEFFKQLIQQLNALWARLSTAQRIVLSSVFIISLVGLIGLITWTNGGGGSKGFSVLYSNLEIEESGSIIEALKESGVDFKVEANGGMIMVPTEKLYEMRMQLAKQGLPKSSRAGYEMFDKTNLGQTDFVQKLNYIRALEGELTRTIETLDEVLKARIHIVIPKPTLFTEKKEEPTASVVLKLKAGHEMRTQQVKGITHVVSAAVEGLKARYVSVMDVSGRILSNPYGDNELAERSSHQIEISRSVEKYLTGKVESILDGVLGPGKSYTKVSVQLNFDQIEKTIEQYNPEGKVVRSEERNEEQTTNSPQGDNRRENNITNYEIDKTVQHIASAVGTIKRISVSSAVDGTYKKGEDGKKEYVARDRKELDQLEDLVKNAVGFDVVRGDQITVSNVKFDNQYLQEQLAAMEKEEKRAMMINGIKYGAIALIVIIFFLFIRYLAKSIIEALNPPVPEYARLAEEEEIPEEIPEDIQRTNEIMERVEMLVKEEPVNVASIIRAWLNENLASKQDN